MANHSQPTISPPGRFLFSRILRPLFWPVLAADGTEVTIDHTNMHSIRRFMHGRDRSGLAPAM